MSFKAPNYTQTPNELFDDIAKTLSEGELRVILVIVRQTFGWRKEWDRISVSQISKKTGMEARSVKRVLKSLLDKNLIKKRKTGAPGEQHCWYALSTEEPANDEIIPDNIEVEDDFQIIFTGDSGSTPPVTLGSPTKETTTKEKAKEKEIKRKGASPPPSAPPLSIFAFKKVHMKGEEYKKLIDEYGEMKVLEKVEALDEYGDINPKRFRQYASHYAVIRNWIRKDLNKIKTENINNNSQLSEAQQKNLKMNDELVHELKLDYPDRCATMSIYYKAYLLKSKEPYFDISMLVDHKEFCRFLEKQLGIKIMEVRFPNG